MGVVVPSISSSTTRDKSILWTIPPKLLLTEVGIWCNGYGGIMARPLAVVTGASSGIGAEFARQLAASGYDLLLVARRLDRLEQLGTKLSEQYGVNSESLVADLAKDDDLSRVEDRLRHDANLRFLVNNAGF